MSNFASGYIKYINHLEQINDGAVHDPRRMIREVEESYRRNLESIAQDVLRYHKGVRMVMLSGPSSSGKTTTAKLLERCLEEGGQKCCVLSLDDFYLPREKVEVQADGRRDFERVDALDAGRIKETFSKLLKTGRAEIPQYDFSLGRARGEDREFRLDPDELVVVEGIHALNPLFTREVPEQACLKLYVIVKQRIKDANGEVVSPVDLRLVRRIVRDVKFRDTSAERTLAMWDQVEEGEDRYIRPYRITADYTVNSIHLYEPCVLRTVAIPLLRAIAPDSPYYRKARNLEAKLMRFEPLDPALVPEESMLREFLGREGLV